MDADQKGINPYLRLSAFICGLKPSFVVPQPVDLAVAAGILLHAVVQAHLDIDAVAIVVATFAEERVDVLPAVQIIVALAAEQRVVSRLAAKLVIAVVAAER